MISDESDSDQFSTLRFIPCDTSKREFHTEFRTILIGKDKNLKKIKRIEGGEKIVLHNIRSKVLLII